MPKKTGLLSSAQSAGDLPRQPIAVRSALDHGILWLSRDMLSIWSFDGLLLDVNPAFTQTLGYTRAELINRPFIDMVHPDDQDAVRDLAILISQGVPVLSFASRFRSSDGSYRWIQSNSIPLYDEGKAYSVSYVDTERTLSQTDQVKAGALQRAIFNSANFSSIATDAKGVIQIFNVGAERMLGYAAEEVMNKITPADISDPQELIVRAKSLSAELATAITPGFEALVFKASRGIEDIYELTYIRKDGSRFPAVVSVTALRDAQDVIIAIC